MSTQIHKTKLTDLKGIDRNTVVVGDCYTPLTSMDRFSKKKIHKATEILRDRFKGYFEEIENYPTVKDSTQKETIVQCYFRIQSQFC